MFRKLFGLGRGPARSKDPEAARLGIDPELRYCPRCGDEYRPDIRMCGGCKVALISGSEKLEQAKRKVQAVHDRSMEISEHDPRVVIRGGKLRDLKAYQLLLARERIPALITGEAGNCGKG